MITLIDFYEENKAKVLLDTNMILAPTECNIDIYDEILKQAPEEINLYVIDKIYYELEMLVNERKGRQKARAKLAREILNSKSIETIDTRSIEQTDVDLMLLNIAKDDKNKSNCYIATSDKVLKDLARKEKIPLIVLRKKQYIIFDNK